MVIIFNLFFLFGKTKGKNSFLYFWIDLIIIFQLLFFRMCTEFQVYIVFRLVRRWRSQTETDSHTYIRVYKSKHTLPSSRWFWLGLGRFKAIWSTICQTKFLELYCRTSNFGENRIFHWNSSEITIPVQNWYFRTNLFAAIYWTIFLKKSIFGEIDWF